MLMRYFVKAHLLYGGAHARFFRESAPHLVCDVHASALTCDVHVRRRPMSGEAGM